MTNKQRFALILFAGGLNAAGAHYFLPPPDSGLPPPEPETAWQLPETSGKPDLNAVYAALRKRLPWGAEQTEAGAAAKKEAAWRFAGVVYEGDKAYMLAQGHDQKISRHTSGENLPDGATVNAIRDDTVEITVQEQAKILHLYQKPSGD